MNELPPEDQDMADYCIVDFWRDPLLDKFLFLWCIRNELYYHRGVAIRVFLTLSYNSLASSITSSEYQAEIQGWDIEIDRVMSGGPTFELLDCLWMAWFATGALPYKDKVVQIAKMPLGSMTKKIHERFIQSAFLISDRAKIAHSNTTNSAGYNS